MTKRTNKRADSGLFRLPPPTAIFEFDPPFKGAWVRCRLNISLRQFLGADGEGTTEEATERETGIRFFVEHVILDWNLADADGNKLPLTYEAFVDIVPAALGNGVMNKWREAVALVPGPLKLPSVDGSPSPEESIETASPSPSQLS